LYESQGINKEIHYLNTEKNRR